MDVSLHDLVWLNSFFLVGGGLINFNFLQRKVPWGEGEGQWVGLMDFVLLRLSALLSPDCGVACVQLAPAVCPALLEGLDCLFLSSLLVTLPCRTAQSRHRARMCDPVILLGLSSHPYTFSPRSQLMKQTEGVCWLGGTKSLYINTITLLIP